MTCRYCHRHHDAGVLCRGVSRRAFFFFGAAAAVTAVAPTLALEPTERLLLGKEVWQALKNHPEIVDRVKLASSSWAEAFDKQVHVDAALTEISLSYQRGAGYVCDEAFPVVVADHPIKSIEGVYIAEPGLRFIPRVIRGEIA